MRTRVWTAAGYGWSANEPSENVRSLHLGGAMVTGAAPQKRGEPFSDQAIKTHLRREAKRVQA